MPDMDMQIAPTGREIGAFAIDHLRARLRGVCHQPGRGDVDCQGALEKPAARNSLSVIDISKVLGQTGGQRIAQPVADKLQGEDRGRNGKPQKYNQKRSLISVSTAFADHGPPRLVWPD